MAKHLIALIFLILSLSSYGAVGTIDSFEGDVNIVSGTRSRLAENALVLETGDIIRSGTNAWALLHMSDGAIVTVRPETEIRVDAYHYHAKEAPGENKSILFLLRGSLRVITGLIGKSNRAGYAVNTPTATIGIRGTDHETSHVDAAQAALGIAPGGTYDKVYSGATVLRNSRGEAHIDPGQIAFADAGARSAPQRLQREPTFLRSHDAIDRRVAPRREQLQRIRDETGRSDNRSGGDSGSSGNSGANSHAESSARSERSESSRGGDSRHSSSERSDSPSSGRNRGGR